MSKDLGGVTEEMIEAGRAAVQKLRDCSWLNAKDLAAIYLAMQATAPKATGGVTEAVARAIAEVVLKQFDAWPLDKPVDFDKLPERGDRAALMEAANAAIAAMQAAAPAAVADGERTAIVSWLRLVAQARDDRADVEWAECLTEAADFIEKGEHLAVGADRD